MLIYVNSIGILNFSPQTLCIHLNIVNTYIRISQSRFYQLIIQGHHMSLSNQLLILNNAKNILNILSTIRTFKKRKLKEDCIFHISVIFYFIEMLPRLRNKIIYLI